MLLALAPSGERIAAEPKAIGACPSCSSSLVTKCGSIVTWHWAHQARPECDPWWEESEWHRTWKLDAAPESIEVKMGPHRADIVGPRGVVELQHSYLAPDEILEREAFYGRMVWLFDATTCADRIELRPRDGFVTFRWRHPRRSIAFARAPLFLDLGAGALLHVRKIGTECPVGGWGYKMERDEFISTYLRKVA